MALTDDSLLVGILPGREQAERAMADLHAAGFTDDQLGIATRGDATGGGSLLEPGDTKIVPGAAVGAVGGGIGGAIIGSLFALAIPGIGPILAGGILGAGISAATGGLFGAVVGLGFADKEAKFYEREFKAGRSLLFVRAGDREAEARRIVTAAGGWFGRPEDFEDPDAEDHVREFDLRVDAEQADLR